MKLCAYPFSMFPLFAGGRREDDRDRETWGLYHQSQERQPGRRGGTPTSRCTSIQHAVSMQELLCFCPWMIMV